MLLLDDGPDVRSRFTFIDFAQGRVTSSIEAICQEASVDCESSEAYAFHDPKTQSIFLNMEIKFHGLMFMSFNSTTGNIVIQQSLRKNLVDETYGIMKIDNKVIGLAEVDNNPYIYMYNQDTQTMSTYSDITGKKPRVLTNGEK